MKGFNSAGQLQRFLSIHSPTSFTFPRSCLSAAVYRAARAQAFATWAEVAGARLPA